MCTLAAVSLNVALYLIPENPQHLSPGALRDFFHVDFDPVTSADMAFRREIFYAFLCMCVCVYRALKSYISEATRRSPPESAESAAGSIQSLAAGEEFI